MANASAGKNAHQTFPLTSQTLLQLSLTPGFSLLDPANARILSARLEPSGVNFTPGEIAAVALIGKIYLHVIDIYQMSANAALFPELDLALESLNDFRSANSYLRHLLSSFPTVQIYNDPASVTDYLFGEQANPDQRHSLYKVFILLLSTQFNPALRQRDGVFTSASYFSSTSYSRLSRAFRSYFQDQDSVPGSGLSLLDLLEAPFRSHPDSLADQLAFIRANWDGFLGTEYLDFILRALDYLKEENVPRQNGSGPPENPLGYITGSYLSDSDPVRFSPDLDWMPNLVLIAKNIYVWLNQLSKKYGTPINTLDQIPDAELACLSSWGISGLWLIGLWERSTASQKIKQICGNPEAVSSAYSLYEYSIASSLGGEEAYLDLSKRAGTHNIRLAADMVPNHMGVYSKWIIEHPDRFLSLDQAPYPSYDFSGPDLSEKPEVGIFIENHYFNQEDAAVVFKRTDKESGKDLFIYHGNDGTAMPWNDTAQLDFLNPETREAVIQTILEVAKKFPVIRFDAAMTLAKKHFQRLWFPEPGSGGAIPTRSENGLTKAEFDQVFPIEFWQEVVDRVAKEAPDTLLLAEAFWMMEGYFVRTLGMHRVYNSAFMHMLRDEDNQKYRELIIQTLDYDPQILKRYVNFMNNPDEDTAISQFGSDGKYFGICVLMSTLPGLPMFGHGQIEGLSEKYGMEYSKPYYDEVPRQELIDRHAREIFPLLKMRHIFSEVDNFYLFDVLSPSGEIHSDVFAFTNRSDSGKALVLYHNAWGDIRGQIHYSTPLKNLSVSILDSLDLINHDADYYLFRDQISNLEYIRSVREVEEDGLSITLGAYEYCVFLDFEPVSDLDGIYQELHRSLQGKGAANLQGKLIGIKYKPFEDQLLSLCDEILFAEKPATGPDAARSIKKDDGDAIKASVEAIAAIVTAIQDTKEDPVPSRYISPALKYLIPLEAEFTHFGFSSLLAFAGFKMISDLPSSDRDLILSHLEERIIELHPDIKPGLHRSVKILHELYTQAPSNLADLIDFWFSSPAVNDYSNVNKFEGHSWFHKESFESMIDLTSVFLLLNGSPAFIADKEALSIFTEQIITFRHEAQALIIPSKFQIDRFEQLILKSFASGKQP